MLLGAYDSEGTFGSDNALESSLLAMKLLDEYGPEALVGSEGEPEIELLGPNRLEETNSERGLEISDREETLAEAELLLETPELLGKSNEEPKDALLGRLLLSKIDSEITLETGELLLEIPKLLETPKLLESPKLLGKSNEELKDALLGR